nr:hypothetical protein [Leptolyngbya sp. FACHB-36]
MNVFSTVIALLRDRGEFLSEIHDSVKLKSKISALLMSSFCFFAVYGAIIGTFHSPLQVLVCRQIACSVLDYAARVSSHALHL